MVTYSPAVIQEMANKLYRQARSIEVAYTLLGFMVGCGLGAFMADEILRQDPIGPAIGLGVVLGAVGLMLGRSKSFALKVQAQLALCQMQIEANTRGASRADTDNA